MIVVSLCDRTGNAVKPWADAGYECYCVDLQHRQKPTRKGNTVYVYGDCRSWVPPEGTRIAFVFGFPPCTHVAGSGARHFTTKGVRMLTDALDTFNSCLMAGAWSGAPYCVENPVGVLSSHVRKPDYSFDPCDFGGYLDPPGDAYTKRTHLWTGNGFVMPEPKPVTPELGSMMHRLPPSDDRADLRSVTPMGFAKAVFLANRRAGNV